MGETLSAIGQTAGQVEHESVLPEDETARARWEHYQALAALLAAPPPAALLGELARVAAHYGQAPTRLGLAWRELLPWLLPQGDTAAGKMGAENVASGKVDADAVAAAWEAEYTALFYGIGRPAVIPYGSYYLTGFMMEEPLADLRAWWAAHGLARCAAQSEPEDHVAALLEAIAYFVAREDEAAQRALFAEFLWPWLPKFVAALTAAAAAERYRAVAEVLSAFAELEALYWELPLLAA